jgi:hypothetical protein
MAVADRNGLPVSVYVESATPHEVTLAVPTLLQMVVPDAPRNLIGDNAYDSDRLDAELRFYGIEVVAPHRRKNSTQGWTSVETIPAKMENRETVRLVAELPASGRQIRTSRRELSRDASARLVFDSAEAFMRSAVAFARSPSTLLRRWRDQWKQLPRW